MIIYNNKAFQPISIKQEGQNVIIKGKYEAIGHIGGMEIDGKYEGGKEVVFYGGIGYKTIRSHTQKRLDRIMKRNVSRQSSGANSTSLHNEYG